MSAQNVVGYYQNNDGFFALVLKEYWDKNQGLDDGSGEEEFVPEGFYAVTEAIYEHEFEDDEEAARVLESAGWVAKEIVSDE